MSQPSRHFYEFDTFRIDPLERLLLRNSIVVPLPPKLFDILLLLVRNNGHLLRKEEIIRAIWPDTFVEEGNLTRYISTLRHTLGKKQDEHLYILTIPRHGYRFVAEVREIGVEGVTQAAAVRSIAVLPFNSLVTEQRDQLLEMGIVETLITCLSSFKQVIVQPVGSIRSYAGLDRDALVAGRELNVEAVLDGSIQRAGNRVRFTVRLLRVEDGSILWAGRFDEVFTDIFAVQDSISERIVAVLTPALTGRSENPSLPVTRQIRMVSVSQGHDDQR